jgi:hypothetical protein
MRYIPDLKGNTSLISTFKRRETITGHTVAQRLDCPPVRCSEVISMDQITTHHTILRSVPSGTRSQRRSTGAPASTSYHLHHALVLIVPRADSGHQPPLTGSA